MKDTDRVVVVTGSARGIGYGIADLFAQRGDRPVIVDVNAAAAAESAAKIKAERGVNAMGIGCDITKRDEVNAAVAEIQKTMGGIDILVNNAGICPFVNIMDMSPEVWNRTIDINLTGAFHCTQEVAKGMITRAEGGRVVFITSLAVDRCGPLQADYAASKAGLRMLMVSWAPLLARHGITCNAVAPGMVYTDMTRRHWDQGDNMKNLKARVPAGRIAYPADIAKAVWFLASPDADYVVGESIRVDGGHQTECI